MLYAINEDAFCVYKKKTTKYFIGRLTLMHKSVNMDWIRRNFEESGKKYKKLLESVLVVE